MLKKYFKKSGFIAATLYILRNIGGSNERIYQGWTLDCPLQVVQYALFLSGNDGLLKRGTPEHVAHRGR
jgi:hypothetical protein